MKNVFFLAVFFAIAGGLNAQNNVILQQSTGGNTNSSASDDKQYYINGISTKEDVGGVEMSRGERYTGSLYFLHFTNYNNFMVSVIYEFEDNARGLITGNIVLKAGEKKQSADYYLQPANFKVIARKMNAGSLPQAMAYQAAPAVNSGGGTVSMRIGVVCMIELMPKLPEYASVQDKINTFARDKQTEYDNLVKEFNSKMELYRNMEDGLKKAAEQELINLQTKIQHLSESNQQELNRYQSDLMAPILSRIQNAVDAVGRANGYDVIIDLSSSGSVMYKGKGFFELDDLVKKELGIGR